MHPLSGSERTCLYSICPGGSLRVTDTSTDTERLMDRDGEPPLLCPWIQRHLEEVWLEWSAEA